MHIIQKKLLELCKARNLGGMTLREIGKLVGEIYPQKIKHHLVQLEKRGLIKINKERGLIKHVEPMGRTSGLLSIPILGTANCGEATIFADECIESYLRVSPKVLRKKSTSLFAIKAVGNSMNRAEVNGQSIIEGDYVIIDKDEQSPENNDYVLSIIDGAANIKKFVRDKKNNQVVLLSESTQDYPPIYIHEKDFSDYIINGKVIQVIKKVR